MPDPLILDDQALVVHVAGKGLVVVTGCGHAGIVNICRYATRLTGVDTLHAVIGGFHLSGPLFEPVIGDTVEALAALDPDVLVPAHCTGWKATHTLARGSPTPSSRTASAPPSPCRPSRPPEGGARPLRVTGGSDSRTIGSGTAGGGESRSGR